MSNKLCALSKLKADIMSDNDERANSAAIIEGETILTLRRTSLSCDRLNGISNSELRRLSRASASTIRLQSSNFPDRSPHTKSWKEQVQPGRIEFIHWAEKNSKEVVISQFHAVTDTHHPNIPVYRRRVCKYRPDATPEEAGFVAPKSHLLGQLTATAICGNDITSSVIYTAGLVASTAGYYTPICLFLVVCLLHLFRSIYTEVVTALPLNGGTYTAILSTTRKAVAVIAACLSFLSYAATVVVSATSAMEYLKGIWPALNVLLSSSVVVIVFACLMLIGLKESGVVALIIFAIHLGTLATLISCALAYACSTNWRILMEHYHWPGPSNPASAIALGFSNAMLGITGFESSANFVQHQIPGVFAKTLRNMWIIVALVNPLTSVLGFSVIPVSVFYENNVTLSVRKEVRDELLATMATEMTSFLGGYPWLEKVIILDAILVLSGAVLTGYVGVVGLLTRMVDDDIFPRAFTARLPLTGANYPIILFFCSVCITLNLVTVGDIQSISGVYTVSFLSVMFLFCISNLVLKHTRRELKRDAKAQWYVVMISMFALLLALVGNCVNQPIIIGNSAIYFGVFMSMFYCMFARTFLIRSFLNLTERAERQPKFLKRLRAFLIKLLASIEAVPVVFFSRRLNLREMNLAVQRVLSDELTKHLVIVHFYHHVNDIPDSLQHNLRILDNQIYPQVRIDIVLVKGTLGPGTIRLIEAILEVPPNRMFIAAPSREFPYNVAELGSVRIIMSRRDRGAAAEEEASLGSGQNSAYASPHRKRFHSLTVVESSAPFDLGYADTSTMLPRASVRNAQTILR